MKGSIETATMKKADMSNYAYACGWTLARAHARSGNRHRLDLGVSAQVM